MIKCCEIPDCYIISKKHVKSTMFSYEINLIFCRVVEKFVEVYTYKFRKTTFECLPCKLVETKNSKAT
jgi:hypothetical protein